MNNKKIWFLSSILFFAVFSGKNLYAYPHEENAKNQINAPCTSCYSTRPKNLAGVQFMGKADIKNAIGRLAYAAKDPYAVSFPLIASAEIGDKTQYTVILADMLKALDRLDNTDQGAADADAVKWMQNNAFKAWMWGRILLSADSIGDVDTVKKAQEKLKELLKKVTANGDRAFFTWAWGYRAALNQEEYAISKESMIDDAVLLTKVYKASGGDHDLLSDALWAWVMSLQAAANAQDQELYDQIKEQIKWIMGVNSVAQALEKGLLRTAQFNDYPAWAMAKTRYAAMVINDKALYQEIENPVTNSMAGADKLNDKTEYVLSVLSNQLAILAEGVHGAVRIGARS